MTIEHNRKPWSWKKKLYSGLYYLSIVVAIGSALYIGWYYFELYQSDKQVEKIQELVKVPVKPTQPVNSGSNQEPATIDFNSLKEINADAIGWIRIDDTKVDYPVVKGKDNEYYLYRNVFKKYDRQGSVFMDYRNVMSDSNIILYAHNMKNGNMFADVAKYRNKEQRDKYPVLQLLMDDIVLKYEVVGAFFYDTKTEDYQYLRRNFSDEEREDYLQFLNERSIYGNITFESTDQLMTLSTCNYDNRGDRFVVILKKVS